MVSKLPYIVLVAGAATSVATSAPPSWNVSSALVDVPKISLRGNESRKLHLSVDATLPPARFRHGELWMGMSLSVTPLVPASEQLDFRLVPLDAVDPGDDGDDEVLDPSVASHVTLNDATAGCPWPTCAREFELTITRTADAAAPALVISGTVGFEASGDQTSSGETEEIERGGIIRVTIENVP